MIECQHPTADLYKFMGALKIFKESEGLVAARLSLALENTLLRGARLKDTEYVYGRNLDAVLILLSSVDWL